MSERKKENEPLISPEENTKELEDIQKTTENLQDMTSNIQRLRTDLDEKTQTRKKQRREKIVNALKNRDISEDDLRKELRITSDRLRKFLEGETDLCMESLIKICVKLGIPLDDIK